jgi:hypothetical protein
VCVCACVRQQIEEHLQLSLELEELKADRIEYGTPPSPSPLSHGAGAGAGPKAGAARDAEGSRLFSRDTKKGSGPLSGVQLQLMQVQNDCEKLRRQNAILGSNNEYVKKLLVTRSEHIVFLE